MAFSHLSHLECGWCGIERDAGVLQNLCPDCGKPLLATASASACPGC
ncbi:hypothetical protein [Actinomadura opuntiae]|nr:hypothetical protein [Actinomadura sp. OS1-43]MDL4814191.1 hypothetical protein [Actinomadura sp. OS1-43]